jgi:hypothetical protein
MRQWASCRLRGDVGKRRLVPFAPENALSEMAKPGAPPAGGLKQTAQAQSTRQL